MKKTILLLFFILVCSQAFSQNTFFIGAKTYPCTKTFTLISNSKNNFGGYNLDVLIAKNEKNGFFVVSTSNSINTGFDLLIKGKLIIYLEDGTVISCTDRGMYDYVDNTATTIYYLTNAEIEKMKKENISTIRFSLKCRDCISSSEEGSYSVSNKGFSYYRGINLQTEEKTDFPSIIRELFD